MRRLTIVYGALIVITLSIACFLIGTFDILVAMACGLGADVYVLHLANQKKKMFVGGRFAPIMLIGVIPIVASILLYIFGYLGSNPVEATYRTATTTGFSVAFFITMYPILPAARFKEIEDHFPDNGKAPLVSVLVPAYNEQTVISRTITSLLATKYHIKK
jgi:hypothetical protein